MSPFPDAIPEVMAQVSSSLFPTRVRSKLVVFFKIFIYLAAQGLDCGTWDLSWQHANS